MRVENIKVAQNGFVLEDNFGNLHIARTLLDAARLAGEVVPGGGYSLYEQDKSHHDLDAVHKLFRAGKKIEAIKLLRGCFVPRLGLREAKDLVEQLCG